MKNIIKKILTEETDRVTLRKTFEIIDKLIPEYVIEELFDEDDLYLIGDTYDTIYNKLVEIGFDRDEANQIIGSYIETYNSVDEITSDDDIIVAKPKLYSGTIKKHISGPQRVRVVSSSITYSKAQAASDIYDFSYKEEEIIDDNTETTDTELEELDEV
jgi:hypothetical protein